LKERGRTSRRIQPIKKEKGRQALPLPPWGSPHQTKNWGGVQIEKSDNTQEGKNWDVGKRIIKAKKRGGSASPATLGIEGFALCFFLEIKKKVKREAWDQGGTKGEIALTQHR